MYDNIPEQIKRTYSESGIELQDISGLVSIGGIAQFAHERDIQVEKIGMEEYMQWSVVRETGIGGVGEDQFEWAIEKLRDPDSGYESEKARQVFQLKVNEALEARREALE